MRLQSEITIEFRAENLCGFQDFGIGLPGGRENFSWHLLAISSRVRTNRKRKLKTER